MTTEPVTGATGDPARDGAYQSPPTEKKVTAATGGAAAVAALLVSILALVEGDQLIEGTPDWIPVLLSVLIAAGTTFAAGRSAPHTARPDLPINQR